MTELIYTRIKKEKETQLKTPGSGTTESSIY
jgi:hypothetical protein